MKKHTLLIVVTVLIFGAILSGCSLNNNIEKSMVNDEFDQKNSVISITGKLTQNGELFFITDSTGVIHDIETYSVSFDEYVGSTVTVTGEYSGDTLFVSEISN